MSDFDPKRRQGCGTQVIGRVIWGEHEGEVRLDWDAAGLGCKIVLPYLTTNNSVMTNLLTGESVGGHNCDSNLWNCEWNYGTVYHRRAEKMTLKSQALGG